MHHQEAYFNFKNRLQERLNVAVQVPHILTPYLSLDMYRTILQNALQAMNEAPEKFLLGPIPFHMPASEYNPRSFHVLYAHEEYGLIFTPNSKDVSGQSRYPNDTLSNETNTKKVRTGYRIDTPEPRSVAVSKYIGSDPYELLDMIQHETDLFETINHPNILPTIPGFVYDDKRAPNHFKGFFISDKADQTLKQWIDANPDLTYEQRIIVFLKILDALGYIHDQGIAHRDIHDENILMIENEPKLIDFELALKGYKNPVVLESSDFDEAQDIDIEELVLIGWKLIYGLDLSSDHRKFKAGIPAPTYRYTPDYEMSALSIDRLVEDGMLIDELKQLVLEDLNILKQTGKASQSPGKVSQDPPVYLAKCYQYPIQRDSMDVDEERTETSFDSENKMKPRW